MSLILEALKRSDRERKAESASEPPLPLPTRGERYRRSLLLPVLATAVAANLLLLILWWRADGRQPPLFTSFDHASSGSAPVEVLPPPIATYRPESPPQSLTVDAAAELAAGRALAAVDTVAAESDATALPSEAALPAIQKEKLSQETSPPAGKAVPIGKLPFQLQRELPDIRIAGHIYDAQPEKRLAIVNGTAQHEGGEIAEGLLLRNINESGLVLDFRGTLFSMGIFERWPPN